MKKINIEMIKPNLFLTAQAIKKALLFIFLSYSLPLFSQLTFQRTYGGTSNDAASCVKQTTDGGYIITGSTSLGAGQNDIFLTKTSSDGTQQWTKTYGGTGDDYASTVQQTNDGGYIIGGTWSYNTVK